ncbi:dihydroxyacetone kinase [Petrotoga sp. 8T1HF07.NaAc.6.1]|uniref:dihydroxyacetone kinase subunit DhaK n=1 Tax=Petrotoga sp. 8T1HF07.NaAc.6.1 TaxID=1351838 RepID=UPI00192C880F|nr:dihydroxyacetone kinase subunit DhaK [Petrotoga sp. 8T1HF07.NaAc.6.1]MBL5981073.1 dihydroxyacetone kinase [Petrotoga sp. 8T1HF07.NaAc.6.1]
MKKLINNPDNVVNEMFEGFLLANKNKVKRIGEINAAARKNVPIKDKVGILIGGGSGHEPMFLELIGKGMADVVVIGDVFAAPPSTAILEATKAANSGKGVLYIYNNYMGDNLNFGMASDLAQMEGINVETVRVWDDVASAPLDRIEERRGIAGVLFIIKIAAAIAETGADLQKVKSTAEEARDNIRSIGVALTSATIPSTGKTTFNIAEDEMEIGMGLHGEPGVKRVKLVAAKETAVTMSEQILQDLPFEKGDEVSVLVNGLGSTTRMELLIMYNELDKILKEKQIKVYDVEIGSYCTTQEMAGCSFTLMKLNDKLKELYKNKADSPGYRFCGK